MSKLDELIRELCPNGVEYKKLGEIATVLRGASPRPIKKYITDDPDGVNWIKIGDVPAGSKYITKSEEKITKEGAEKSRYVRRGDFILSNSMSFGRPYILAIDGCIHDGWLSIANFEDVFISDYLYYLLSSTAVQQEMKKRASFGGAVQNLNADIVKALDLPIPPLDVQREIVRILDNFTNLTAELTKELTDRKVQYAYYRNKFLYFDESSASLKSIGDICNVVVGGEPPADCIKGESKDSSHMFPVWGNGKEAYGYSGTYKIDRDAVVISSIGANTGAVYYRKAFFTPIIRLKVVMPKDNQLSSRFLFHVLSATAIKSKSSSVPNMNANEIKAIKIPVPPLDVQNRIVNVLDNFEKICSDLNIGLPAEIEARQKQYEYYRDKLLTFAETGNTILSRAEH